MGRSNGLDESTSLPKNETKTEVQRCGIGSQIHPFIKKEAQKKFWEELSVKLFLNLFKFSFQTSIFIHSSSCQSDSDGKKYGGIEPLTNLGNGHYGRGN
jgi:hypothetical protein